VLLYHPGNLEGEGEEGRDNSSFSMGYQEEKLLKRKLNKEK